MILKIFILEAGDEIKAVSGENAYFDNTRVAGKLKIKTVKGIEYGPFGHSGSRLNRKSLKNIQKLFKFRK